MTHDLDSIRRRIRALRALTTENGCTEAEAMAAAAKVMALMAEYGLDQAAIDAPEWQEECAPTQGRSGPQDDLWLMIAHVCQCSAVFRHGVGPRQVIYLGRAPWPEVATYLHQVCFGVVERASAGFRAGLEYRRLRKPHTRAKARRSFTEGLVDRLAAKVLDYARRHLGPLNKAATLAAHAEMGRRYRLQSSRPIKGAGLSRRARDFRAAGSAAGQTVSINPAAATGPRAPALLPGA
ncbi:DUF2786 domain-containing protein [Niveispirillum sp. SYP-B3756]|uniref:DUF7168 domain-containing protein n=1 Tax=Niveispirillum sp. SYP-B3756 TaxID=2662178 RepID=UPI001292A062|nr:DUF2786 domain-containing protein [Niveispirillum sp. SYP-B3756]MQP64732.1 DUF2786 domain-containing protein [Niveispirillum sp. SYP-B3756]